MTDYRSLSNIDDVKLTRIRVKAPVKTPVVVPLKKKKAPKHDRSHDPVTIRGIEYFDYFAAADELGVTVQAIHNARNLGRLNSVGMGCGNNNRRAVWIGDKLYPSLRKAAEAHGVNSWYFSELMRDAKAAGKDTVFTKYGWVKIA